MLYIDAYHLQAEPVYDHDELTTLRYDRQKFGKAVRAHRGPQTPQHYAKRARISPAVLSRVERGKIVYDDVIEKLCELTGLDLADFPPGRAGKPGDEG